MNFYLNFSNSIRRLENTNLKFYQKELFLVPTISIGWFDKEDRKKVGIIFYITFSFLFFQLNIISSSTK